MTMSWDLLWSARALQVVNGTGNELDSCFALGVASGGCELPVDGEESSSGLWYVGVIVSIIGSVLSNFGVNTQKYSMIQEIRNDRERSYAKQPIWVIGMLMVIVGALADFAALGFAAQSLITPVGGFTMVANLFFASYWLGERITRLDFMSTWLIIGGIVLIAAFADKSDQCFTLDMLKCLYKRKEFIAYAVMTGGLMVLVYLAIKVTGKRLEALKAMATDKPPTREFKRLNKMLPLFCASLSGLIGAQSVLFAKSTIEILKSAGRGNPEFKSFATYAIIISMFMAIFGQIHWLAVGLEKFDAVVIVPVFQCVFVLFTIIAGAAYFGEFRDFNSLQQIFFPLGVLLLVIGVVGLAKHKSRSAEELIDNDSAAFKDLRLDLNPDSEGGSSSEAYRERALSRVNSAGSSSWEPNDARRASFHRLQEFNALSPYGAVTGRWIPLEFLLGGVGQNLERVGSFLQRVNSHAGNLNNLSDDELRKRSTSGPIRAQSVAGVTEGMRAMAEVDLEANNVADGNGSGRELKSSSFAGVESLLHFNNAGKGSSTPSAASVAATAGQEEEVPAEDRNSDDDDDDSSDEDTIDDDDFTSI